MKTLVQPTPLMDVVLGGGVAENYAWFKRIAEQHGKVTEFAKMSMTYTFFPKAEVGQLARLGRVSVRDLGITRNAQYEQVLRAVRRRYGVCHPQTALPLRHAYQDQPRSENLLVASDTVRGFNDTPFVFTVGYLGQVPGVHFLDAERTLISPDQMLVVPMH